MRLLKPFLFWTHLAVGLVAGSVIVVLSVTGMILAFKAEVLSVTEREVRRVSVPATSVGQAPISYDEMRTLVASTYGDSHVKGMVVSRQPDVAVAVLMSRGLDTVYLNPYTGEVLGTDSAMVRFFKTVEAVHRWFGFQEGPFKDVAHHVKAASTVAFVFLLLSGVYLWWPFKTYRLRFKGVSAATYWNWHTALGFWLSPFILIIGITGIVMSYDWANAMVYRLTGSPVPPKREGMGRNTALPSGLARVFQTAKTASPTWVSLTVRATPPGRPVIVMVEEEGPGDLKWYSRLTVDPQTADIRRWEPIAEETLGRKVRTWIRYLHTGEAGGLFGKLMAFVASAVGVVLVITGFLLSWKRFTKKG